MIALSLLKNLLFFLNKIFLQNRKYINYFFKMAFYIKRTKNESNYLKIKYLSSTKNLEKNKNYQSLYNIYL